MICCKVESRFSNLDSSGAEPLCRTPAFALRMPGTHHWYTTGPARHRGSTSEATVVHRWCWQALKQHNTLTLGSPDHSLKDTPKGTNSTHMSMNNSVTTPDISAATLAVTNLSGALHRLNTYLGQEAAQNAEVKAVFHGLLHTPTL